MLGPLLINSRGWKVPEPMPQALIVALYNHPRLSNRAALFTCWGLKEERQYLQNLEAAPSLSELAIDFRQRQYVKAEQLAEPMFYQKKLLLRQQKMKSLTFCIRHEAEGRFVDQIDIDPQEWLPCIERLSLECYRFDSDRRGVQFHLSVHNLRSLTLIACTNWHLLLGLPEMKFVAAHHPGSKMEYASMVIGP